MIISILKKQNHFWKDYLQIHTKIADFSLEAIPVSSFISISAMIGKHN